MIIGVPRETKADEYRVGLLPVGADLLTRDGHTVLMERGAGLGCGFEDEQFESAGCEMIETAAEIYDRSDLLLGVKEPQPDEIRQMKPGQIVFCYFHFAGSRKLTEDCLNAGITALAFETVEDAQGRLPLLTPMSEVAGRMSIQEGAKFLEKPMEGRGILLGGVPGVEPANVLILGGGVVGSNAARVAAGLGANVTLMDVNLDRLRFLDEIMPANVTMIYSDPHAIAEHLIMSDLVVGAVLITGGRAPSLVTRQQLSTMKNGAVIVDVAIDQGGCVETARPTTHKDPIYIVDGVVHYCVANMPGAVGRTSSQALANATLPYMRQLAGLGVEGFMARSPGHAGALNMQAGRICHAEVARAFEDLPCAGSRELVGAAH